MQHEVHSVFFGLLQLDTFRSVMIFTYLADGDFGTNIGVVPNLPLRSGPIICIAIVIHHAAYAEIVEGRCMKAIVQ